MRLMRPLSPMLRYFILFVCVGFPLAAAGGQTPNAGGLRVVVKETQDLPVAGANCSLSAVPPGQTPIAAATSDEQGTARFTNVARGRYTLTVAKEGFETFARSDVIIDEKPENQIVVVLTVAAVREKVTVTAPSEAATSVETGSTIASGNIKRETLRSLPLAVARVDQALPLIPGVIRSTKGELSIKGASEAQSGPLVADRLYLSQTAAYTIAKRPVRGLSYPDNETRTESQSHFSQFDLILNGHHTQSFTLGYFSERNQHVNLDFFTPKSTTPNYHQRDSSFTARDHYAFGPALLESMFSFKRFDANVWGQGTSPQILTPTVEQGNYFATVDRRSSRIEFLEVYTAPKKEFWGGSHEIKAGFDFNHVGDALNYGAHPVRILRADGSLAELIEFGVRPRRMAHNNEYTGFIQDRWLVRPGLSIDLGLRFEDQRIASEDNLAPRAGFAWSPTGSDQTVVRGGVGLFYDKVPLNIRGFSRYPNRTVTTYGADGQTMISRVNFVDSHTRRIYVVNPELDYRGTSAIVLRSAGDATYRALEVTSRFTLKGDDAIYLTYVRSRSRGDLNDFNSYFGDLGAPVIRSNQYSNLAFDVPNRVVAWGKVSLPRRSSISPIIEWRSGFPFSARDENQNFVGVRNSDQTRFPEFFSLDVEVAKEFKLTKKYGVRLSVLGFNLTNHFNPRDVHANISDRQFREFFASYRRYFTGGFDILF